MVSDVGIRSEERSRVSFKISPNTNACFLMSKVMAIHWWRPYSTGFDSI